jgi:WD40 repeat protein
MAITVLPDKRIVSGAADGTIRIWRADGAGCDAVIVVHAEHVLLRDDSVKAQTMYAVIKPYVPSPECHISSLAVLPDGRIVSGSSDSIVHIWRAEC